MAIRRFYKPQHFFENSREKSRNNRGNVGKEVAKVTLVCAHANFLPFRMLDSRTIVFWMLLGVLALGGSLRWAHNQGYLDYFTAPNLQYSYEDIRLFYKNNSSS